MKLILGDFGVLLLAAFVTLVSLGLMRMPW